MNNISPQRKYSSHVRKSGDQWMNLWADYDRNILTYCSIHCVVLNRCALETNVIQTSH